VKSLIVHLDLLSQASGQGADETLEVSHMVAREIPTDGLETALAPSPGIRIMIPRNGFLPCTVEQATIKIPQDMALIISGKSPTRLMPPKTVPEGETHARRLRLIAFNATLNGTVRLEDRLNLPTLADYTPSARIAGLFDQLRYHDESILLTSGSADISQNLLALLLVTFVLKTASAPINNPLKPHDGNRISKLKSLMISNLNHNMTTTAMAAHLGMSRPAFCQWSKIYLGQTPKHYLKELRMERSQELLSQGVDSIEAIAEKIGFSDRFHFDKEFKRYFNVTPASYRRQTGTGSEVDFLGPALERFRQGNFPAALQSCEKGLESARSTTIQDQLRYLKGNCLQATGNPQEALMIWYSLRKSSCAHSSGMASCRLHYSSGQYDQAAQCLQERYLNSESEERLEVVTLWMEQVRDLFENRRPQPLRAYLDSRLNSFAYDDISMGLTARVLLAMGQYEEVLQQCARLPNKCFQALYRAGQLDEAIRRYGNHVDAATLKNAVHHSGLAEKALAMPPEIPEIDAESLTELGRAEEAIRRFPLHAATAFLTLGRYEDLLNAVPQPGYTHLHALHALGRIKALKQMAKDHPELWGEAQLYLDPSVILSTQGSEAEQHKSLAVLLLTLQALNAGKPQQAAALLETCEGVDSPDLWWTSCSRPVLLVTTILRGFLLGPRRMQSDLDLILSRYRLQLKQSLWHDAAYLTRTITHAQYMKQPLQADLARRVLVIDAITHDLAHRKDQARRAYETALQRLSPYPASQLLQQQFIRWRLNTL